MSIFKRIPIPLCAVALGMFGLGNLLQSYSEGIRLLCGAVAAVLLLLFLISVIVDFKKFLGEMKNPIMASVFCTFPMALMLCFVYLPLGRLAPSLPKQLMACAANLGSPMPFEHSGS